MVNISLKESPIRYAKETKVSRKETDTIKEGECKIIRRPFKKDALICVKDGKLKVKTI